MVRTVAPAEALVKRLGQLEQGTLAAVVLEPREKVPTGQIVQSALPTSP